MQFANSGDLPSTLMALPGVWSVARISVVVNTMRLVNPIIISSLFNGVISEAGQVFHGEPQVSGQSVRSTARWSTHGGRKGARYRARNCGTPLPAGDARVSVSQDETATGRHSPRDLTRAMCCLLWSVARRHHSSVVTTKV